MIENCLALNDYSFWQIFVLVYKPKVIGTTVNMENDMSGANE